MTRAENEITKFIKECLAEELTPKLLKIGFTPAQTEKRLTVAKLKEWKTAKFDLWGKERKKCGCFAIWEIEVAQVWGHSNVYKTRGILNYSWKPKVFFFQIFSPILGKSVKEDCLNEANDIKKYYRKKFIYKQFALKMPKTKFEDTKERFESNSKRYGRKELEKEVKRIARESVKSMLKFH
jgi:hypothetical protein